MRFKTKKKQSAPSRIRTHATFIGSTARNIIDLVQISSRQYDSNYSLLPSMTLVMGIAMNLTHWCQSHL